MPAAAGELDEARESLTYWETRLQKLPVRALRKRREARAMAARWHARVSEAEKRRYGAGLLGMLLLLVSERRLPVDAQRRRRRMARTAVRAGVAMGVALVALLVVAGVAAVELLAAILHAL